MIRRDQVSRKLRRAGGHTRRPSAAVEAPRQIQAKYNSTRRGEGFTPSESALPRSPRATDSLPGDCTTTTAVRTTRQTVNKRFASLHHGSHEFKTVPACRKAPPSPGSWLATRHTVRTGLPTPVTIFASQLSTTTVFNVGLSSRTVAVKQLTSTWAVDRLSQCVGSQQPRSGNLSARRTYRRRRTFQLQGRVRGWCCLRLSEMKTAAGDAGRT